MLTPTAHNSDMMSDDIRLLSEQIVSSSHLKHERERATIDLGVAHDAGRLRLREGREPSMLLYLPGGACRHAVKWLDARR